MPKEYLSCVKALIKDGKSKAEAQKICAINYYKKHRKTPSQAEKMQFNIPPLNPSVPPLTKGGMGGVGGIRFADEDPSLLPLPDIPPETLALAFNLPPEEAIKFLESKGYVITWDWHELLNEAHAKAFTVAKVAQLDILQDIHNSVIKAIREGLTFQSFKKELIPTLIAKGWWGKDEAGNMLGSLWRLKTIYRTNLQSAYMAGRWKGMMDVAHRRPYWQYIAVLDSRTRPSHRALHGKVFRYDDPIWKSIYPPNGWNCRCRVRSLSERELEKRGLKVESSKGRLSKAERLVSKKTGEVQEVTVYTDPATGKTMSPDVGFNYNPGFEAWRPDLTNYYQDLVKMYLKYASGGK